MDMGAVRAFKHPGDEDVVFPEAGAADRADPLPFAVKAVHAAPYVHEPVLSAAKRGEGRRFDQFALGQFGGTYRTGLGCAGVTFGRRLPLTPPPGAAACGHTDTGPYKQGIPEPEQEGSYDGKGQNLDKILHS
jgi:hypothetical protein